MVAVSSWATGVCGVVAVMVHVLTVLPLVKFRFVVWVAKLESMTSMVNTFTLPALSAAGRLRPSWAVVVGWPVAVKANWSTRSADRVPELEKVPSVAGVQPWT